ncbi:MAG TPA: tRNA (guanosine(37)-N1)-methyltransferase TrmD [Armatimonadota bacterium]|jgi:tRNA (guanine37-N1)-methyltransferase
MRFDVVTIFPEYFSTPLECSILGRARAAGLVDIRLHNLRDYTTDRHQVVDDYPFGGGGGMVLKPAPLFAAHEALLAEGPAHVVLLSPQGQTFDQPLARELAERPRIMLLCGHYEGFDERVRQTLVDQEISLGDFVLTGGEPAALVIIDAVTRLLPGVLGDEQAPSKDSFAEDLLEYPHYTRPAEFAGLPVPEVLLSGHHEMIRRWRRKESLRRTLQRRPDLLKKAALTREDEELLDEIAEEEEPGQ